MKLKSILLLVMITFFYTCSSHKKSDRNDNSAKEVITFENFEKGRVIEKVQCANDTTQS